MKRLTFLFFFFCTSTYGQIDTSKIKIITKYYNEYIIANETNCYNENIDTIYTDTLTTYYEEIFEYSYPFIQTTDRDLNKIINDTISKIVGRNNNSIEVKWGWKCIFDKPAENYMNYKVHFISPYFISITINTDAYAGGGGNGSSHGTIALTFDLVNKKVLNTADIFKKQSYRTAYTIFKQQFDLMAKSEFASHEKFNRLDSLFWVQNKPFALFTDKIILYTAVSYGHGSYDGEIIYEFDKYKNLFDKKFITTVKKK